MSYDPKQSEVLGRALKVQKLSIPFTITGDATAADVLLRSDEPAVMFQASEGVDQITAALLDDETATFTVAPDDSDGKSNVLLRIGEQVEKVVSMYCANRVSGAAIVAKLGSASGITEGDGGGTAIMISLDSAVDYTAADEDACLEVEYVVAE